MKKHIKRKNFAALSVLIISFMVVLAVLLLLLDKKVRPAITRASQNSAEIIVNKAVNSSVSTYLKDSGVLYNDLAIVSYDSEKIISSIEIDAITLNYIKTRITDVIVDEILKSKKVEVGIPVGNLTSNDLLIGRGPKINFDIDLSCAVSTDYKSVFKKAGINNTVHQIIIEVKCKYYILMPWYQTQSEYITSFILAQTVIVGRVPDNFTSVFDDEGDIVGDIFDYGTIND